MDYRLVFGLLIVCLMICYTSYNFINDNLIFESENHYHGPVPKDYDLEHYRDTGETIMEDNN